MVNHKDDIMNQDIEDCVLLMPYNQGYWNDVPCGHWDTGEHLSGSSGTELHHFLCEYGKYIGAFYVKLIYILRVIIFIMKCYI